MLNKPVNMLLYLAAVTTLFFYMPKIIAAIGEARNSHDAAPITVMGHKDIDQDAYYALREAAAIQLGQIVVSYSTDKTTGRYKASFQNAACPSPDADPEVLKKEQSVRVDELHSKIMSWKSCADTDHSGFVNRQEGALFLNIFELGHLVEHGLGGLDTSVDKIAQATGKTSEEVAASLIKYQDIVVGCP